MKAKREKRKRSDDDSDNDARHPTIRFGDVAQAPPTISVVPKQRHKDRSQTKKKPSATKNPLSMFQKKQLEAEREKVVELYRMQKKQRLAATMQ